MTINKTSYPATLKARRANRHKPQKAKYDLLKKRFLEYSQKVKVVRDTWQNANIRFKKVIENAPLPILITKGTEPTIEYVNPAWEKLTGYQLEEVKGKNPNILHSGKTSKKNYETLWEKLKTGKSYTSEFIFNTRKDGSIYQMSSTMFPIKSLGRTLFYAQIEHDITKRKRREKYKSMYVKVVEIITESKTLPEGIPKILKYICLGGGWEMGELWLADPDRSVLRFTGAWNTRSLNADELKNESKQVTFLPGKGLPGRVWQSNKPAWILNSTENTYFPTALSAAKLGLTTALAFPLIIDYQTIGVLTFFTTVAREPDNDLVKAIASLGNHLGQFIEHKRTEELLLKITKQNELILNTAGDGIYGLDKNGNASFVNPAAAEMFGWKPADLIGKSLHELIHHTQPNGKTPYSKTDCPIYKVLTEVNAPKTSIEVFWKKDGTSFLIEGVYTPLIDKKKIIGVVVVFKDITKRQKLEDMRKEFLSIAAHELKTPITTLKLLSQHQLITIEKKGIQSVNVEDLKSIDRELNRLTRIINDILDDQKIETGKLNLHINRVDLSALIEHTIHQVQSLSPTHKITYHKKSNPFVTADRDRIQQVLTNLLTNAIKYSAKHTNITISTKIQNNTVVVSVKDQGRGILLSQQDRIFDRFYQIQEGKSPGFGLGLYICKQIMERNHGKIWVNSKEGEGSTFHFSLPLASE